MKSFEICKETRQFVCTPEVLHQRVSNFDDLVSFLKTVRRGDYGVCPTDVLWISSHGRDGDLSLGISDDFFIGDLLMEVTPYPQLQYIHMSACDAAMYEPALQSVSDYFKVMLTATKGHVTWGESGIIDVTLLGELSEAHHLSYEFWQSTFLLAVLKRSAVTNALVCVCPKN